MLAARERVVVERPKTRRGPTTQHFLLIEVDYQSNPVSPQVVHHGDVNGAGVNGVVDGWWSWVVDGWWLSGWVARCMDCEFVVGGWHVASRLGESPAPKPQISGGCLSESMLA